MIERAFSRAQGKGPPRAVGHRPARGLTCLSATAEGASRCGSGARVRNVRVVGAQDGQLPCDHAARAPSGAGRRSGPTGVGRRPDGTGRSTSCRTGARRALGSRRVSGPTGMRGWAPQEAVCGQCPNLYIHNRYVLTRYRRHRKQRLNAIDMGQRSFTHLRDQIAAVIRKKLRLKVTAPREIVQRH